MKINARRTENITVHVTKKELMRTLANELDIPISALYEDECGYREVWKEECHDDKPCLILYIDESESVYGPPCWRESECIENIRYEVFKLLKKLKHALENHADK